MPAAAATTAQPKTRKKRCFPRKKPILCTKTRCAKPRWLACATPPTKGPGFSRKATRAGKFAYYDAYDQKISDAKTLERISSFVIPPAWMEVWISPSATTHLQVTGHGPRRAGPQAVPLPPGLGCYTQPHQVCAPTHLQREVGIPPPAVATGPGPPGARPRQGDSPSAQAHGPVVYSRR